MPNDKKTIAEAKNNSRSVKRQQPNKQNTTAEELGSEKRPTVCVGLHKTTAARSKNNCRTAKHNCRIIKKQMPKYQKTTVEKSKDKIFNLSKIYNFLKFKS